MSKENPFDLEGKRQKQVDKVAKKPFMILKEGETPRPYYVVDNHPNDEHRFAILKTTEGGKYVRNGLLYFRFNGVEIFTELNNAIFVDTISNTVFIKDYSRVTEEITPVDPETRQYILLMKCTEYDDVYYKWEAMQGRNTTYDYIRDNIEALCIDPDESFVLVENVPYKDALSISAFVQYVQNAELVPLNDGFDITEYSCQF